MVFPDEHPHGLGRVNDKTYFQINIEYIFGDFGSRSPVFQKPFQQKQITLFRTTRRTTLPVLVTLIRRPCISIDSNHSGIAGPSALCIYIFFSVLYAGLRRQQQRRSSAVQGTSGCSRDRGAFGHVAKSAYGDDKKEKAHAEGKHEHSITANPWYLVPNTTILQYHGCCDKDNIFCTNMFRILTGLAIIHRNAGSVGVRQTAQPMCHPKHGFEDTRSSNATTVPTSLIVSQTKINILVHSCQRRNRQFTPRLRNKMRKKRNVLPKKRNPLARNDASCTSMSKIFRQMCLLGHRIVRRVLRQRRATFFLNTTPHFWIL